MLVSSNLSPMTRSAAEEEDEDDDQTSTAPSGAYASPALPAADAPAAKRESRSSVTSQGAPPPMVETPSSKTDKWAGKSDKDEAKSEPRSTEPQSAKVTPPPASGWVAMTRPLAKGDGSSSVPKKDEPSSFTHASILKQPDTGAARPGASAPKKDASTTKQDTSTPKQDASTPKQDASALKKEAAGGAGSL